MEFTPRQSFFILIPAFYLVTKVGADLLDDVTTQLNDLNESMTNDLTYSNESKGNESAYQCIGPSEDDVKLYHVLAWWMDGVVQVQIILFWNGNLAIPL